MQILVSGKVQGQKKSMYQKCLDIKHNWYMLKINTKRKCDTLMYSLTAQRLQRFFVILLVLKQNRNHCVPIITL